MSSIQKGEPTQTGRPGGTAIAASLRSGVRAWLLVLVFLLALAVGRRNAGADCITNQSSVVDLSPWSVFQYDVFTQGNASWTLSQSNTVALQSINADASILLSPFVLTNEQIQGRWLVNTNDDDDFIGFVFGYQDDRHFYLFDWKQIDQNTTSWGNSLQGMSVKVLTAGTPLTDVDLGTTVPANTNRGRLLYHNNIPWQDYTAYDFDLRFQPGFFTITVSQGTNVLDTIAITDATYTNGRFGFYNFSQSQVEYSGFTRRDIAPQPIITVADRAVVEGNTGTTSLVFSINLSVTNCEPTLVDYFITPGTATAGVDYTAVASGTLVFLPGETNQLITVTVNGDIFYELDETFFLTLTNVVSGAIGNGRAVGTIINDDPRPVLSIDGVSVIEGNAGSTLAVFPLTLTGATEVPAQVSYRTVNGTATAGSDYQALALSALSIPAGQTSATIAVAVFGDTLVELDETFFLCLTNGTNVILPGACATGLIINDDTNRFPTVVLTQPAGNPCLLLPTNLTVAASASDPDGTIARVEFFVGTNALGQDLTSPYSLVWSNVPAGVSSLSAVAQDNSGARATSAPVVVSASFPSALSINDQTVIEGNTGTNMVFTISLTPPSCRTVAVAVATINGTALAGLDFSATNAGLVFLPGETSLSFAIPIVGDTRAEPDEYFLVCLTNVTGATLARACGTGTIINDDTNSPPLCLLNPASQFTVNVGEPMNFSIFSGDPDEGDMVTLAVSGLPAGAAMTPPLPATGPEGYVASTFNWIPGSGQAGNHLVQFTVTDLDGSQSHCDAQIAVRPVADLALRMTASPVTLGLNGAVTWTLSVTNRGPSPATAVIVTNALSAGMSNVAFATSQGACAVTSGALNCALGSLATGAVASITLTANLVVKGTLSNTASVSSGTLDPVVSNNTATAAVLVTNAPPVASITTPVDGAQFLSSSGVVPIAAAASDSDGWVGRVEFFANGSLIGVSTNGPWQLPWANNTAGGYVLTAVATDNDGAWGTSAPVHIIIRSCDTNLSATPLTNLVRCLCDEVIFSTTVTSVEPASFVWRANGVVLPGETRNTLRLQDLHAAQAGSYTVEISTPCSTLALGATLTLKGTGNQNPVPFANTNGFVISDSCPVRPCVASLYPSSILVDCLPAPIKHLSVTIDGINHGFPGDLDVLLVGPGGQAVKLMSDCGRGGDLGNVVLTFTDTATTPLPDPPPIISGTYRPTDYGVDLAFPAPAPGGTPGANFSSFIGAQGNGIWSLYVVDDQSGDAGTVTRGWSLNLEWQDTPPELTTPTLLPDGRFQTTLLGLPRMAHVVEASFNLNEWTPVSTNTLTGPTLITLDPDPAGPPWRFFRAVRCP